MKGRSFEKGTAFNGFDPEKSFSEGAENALAINKKTREKKAVEETKRMALLEKIAEARKRAEISGDYTEATDLLATLYAQIKYEMGMDDRFTPERIG